jgi:GxxExxY protein
MDIISDDDLSRRVIGLAIGVHRQLGPGLAESMDETGPCDALAEAARPIARERQSPARYENRIVDGRYQPDVIVEATLMLEIKANYQSHPIQPARLMTYTNPR